MPFDENTFAPFEQVERSELIIPAEATHQQQISEVFDDIGLWGMAAIAGPSRAGKTTFLTHSLHDTFERNGHSPKTINGFENPDQVVEQLGYHQSAAIIDEMRVTLCHDKGVAEAVRDRIRAGLPTVICTTYFENNHDEEDEFSEWHSLKFFLEAIGREELSIIEFPLAMTPQDATKVLIAGMNDFPPGDASTFADHITSLTTQPRLISRIMHAAHQGETLPQTDDDIKAMIGSTLVNTVIERSLQAEAQALWQHIYPDELYRRP